VGEPIAEEVHLPLALCRRRSTCRPRHVIAEGGDVGSRRTGDEGRAGDAAIELVENSSMCWPSVVEAADHSQATV